LDDGSFIELIVDQNKETRFDISFASALHKRCLCPIHAQQDGDRSCYYVKTLGTGSPIAQSLIQRWRNCLAQSSETLADLKPGMVLGYCSLI